MNSLKSFTIPKSTKIYELNNAFPADKKIPLGKEFRLLTNNVSYSTHTIHKYPSKFIPQVPHWAIQKYLKDVPNSYVFDLMCGSGTTMLEAFLQNKNSVGVDVDPLACLISKVKKGNGFKLKLFAFKFAIIYFIFFLSRKIELIFSKSPALATYHKSSACLLKFFNLLI